MTMAENSPHCHILIVGAGLAGLFCALECTRHGFRPTVLESRSTVQTAGDFISLGPSALRSFQKWPSLYKTVMAAVYHPDVYYHDHTGEQRVGPLQLDPSFGYLISRPSLHTALVEALSAAGIEVLCNKRVISYGETETAGFLELANGEKMEGDLIIAADGIHSKSWQVVNGEEPTIYSSGNAIFRAAFPLKHVAADHPLRQNWTQDDGKDKMGFFLGRASHGIMLFGHDTVSWVWMHKDNPETSSEGWSASLSADTALEQLDEAGNWSSTFRSLIAVTPPKHIIDWRLLWRDLTSQWVSPKGHVCQIGDSAHPFLPTSVNGGTQALEDAASLPVCLRLGANQDARRGLAMGARVHNTFRFERVRDVQATGKKRMASHHGVDWEAVKLDPKRLINPIEPWIVRHDPIDYAEKHFNECVGCLRRGEHFANTNLPQVDDEIHGN